MKTDEMQKLLVSLILFLSIIVTFYFFRMKTDSGLFTYDEYKYIEKSQDIISHNFTKEILIKNFESPVVILLALSNEYKLLMRLLPYLFIIINFILIYSVSKKAPMAGNHRFYSVIYLFLSPIFIYISTVFNLAFISLSLILFGLLLFINNNPFPGLVLFLLSLWVTPWNFFIIAIILVFIFKRMKKTRTGFGFFGISIILIFFITLKGVSIPSSFNLLELAREYITDLGAGHGVGIFGLLAVFIGIFLYLRDKEKKEKEVVWFLLVFALFSLYDKYFLVFAEILSAFFSGFGIYKIVHGNWDSGVLKNYVSLLIFCGLIFSAGSYLNKSYPDGADYGERLSTSWLKDNAEPNVKIISHYEFGYFLTRSSLLPYTDKDYYLYSKEKGKINESKEIFMARDLKKISSFLSKNNIRYIWINTAMKNNLVWSKEEEGMLFTLKNSVSFRKIYDYLGIEIWEFMESART